MGANEEALRQEEAGQRELVLTAEEARQVEVDDRRFKLLKKFDRESRQGILPFTDTKFHEQSNPILRSALFSSQKMGGRFNDWTDIFSLDKGSIQYRGPSLTVDHEVVLAKIMMLARGRSLTKPVQIFQADILRWLGVDDSGTNFKRARLIIEDLSAGEIRISCKSALSRIYTLLTDPQLKDIPDGEFFVAYIRNRHGDQLKEIGEALAKDLPVEITMKFLTNRLSSSKTGKMILNLDPIIAIFFDGVNTTLVPFEIWEQLDRFGKKLLPFIASHRAGVFPIRLESYHEFSGSKSEYQKVKRRMKSDFKKRLNSWEELNYIEPGWDIYRNDDGEEIVCGLKAGRAIRIRSSMELIAAPKRDGMSPAYAGGEDAEVAEPLPS